MDPFSPSFLDGIIGPHKQLFSTQPLGEAPGTTQIEFENEP